VIQKNCWFINSYPRSKRGCAAGGSTKFALFCGSYLPNFLKQPVITAFFNPEEIFRATFKYKTLSWNISKRYRYS